MKSRFHLAFHVRDLESARAFYGGVLSCREGRCTDTWVDFNFFGHQITLHLGEPFACANTGRVDGQAVPMPHLGVVLETKDWRALAERMQSADVEFVIAPQMRFAGEAGEQWTMFFRDPSGNPIEVKGVDDLERLFDA